MPFLYNNFVIKVIEKFGHTYEYFFDSFVFKYGPLEFD